MIFGCYQMKGQILYDNGPIDDNPNFSIEGKKWDHSNLTYYFENETDDIDGTTEKNAIVQAMQVWSSVTVFTFTEVTTAANADIVIKWAVGDHGDGTPFDGVTGVLAHAYYPPPNSGSLAGDLHFDDSESWSVNVQSGSSQPIDLVTVAIHELGHSLGLKHSNVLGAIMYPTYYGSLRTLSSDDIQGIQTLYPIPYTLYGSNSVCAAPSQSFVGITPTPPVGSSITWSTSSNLIVSSTLPPSSSNTPQVLVQGTLAPGVYQTGIVTAIINGVPTPARTVNIGPKPFSFSTQKATAYTENCDQTYHYVAIDVINSDTSMNYNYTFGNFMTGIANPGVTYTQLNPTRFLFKIPLNKIPSGSNPVFGFSLSTTGACSTTPFTSYGLIVVLKPCNSSFALAKLETDASSESANAYTVYPNPATNVLNISLNDSKSNLTKNALITGNLYDFNGQQLTQVAITGNTATLDVSKFKKGIYILKININGTQESHQVIIN